MGFWCWTLLPGWPQGPSTEDGWLKSRELGNDYPAQWRLWKKNDKKLRVINWQVNATCESRGAPGQPRKGRESERCPGAQWPSPATEMLP